MDNSYLVAYGKIIDDKEEGVYLAGVYFGGVATCTHEAEAIAKNCVQYVRGGSIIPKIVRITNSVIGAMDEASKRFYELERSMIEAEDVLIRNQQIRR